MRQCYVFDIDGTLADINHRLPLIQGAKKDWDAFFAACADDAPIAHMCELARSLSIFRPVAFVSGRSDQVRELTVQWLARWCSAWQPNLYMRSAGDHRPDDVVKSELLNQLLADGFEPIMLFEDRDRVVKMWRERGYPCAQVAEGAF